MPARVEARRGVFLNSGLGLLPDQKKGFDQAVERLMARLMKMGGDLLEQRLGDPQEEH